MKRTMFLISSFLFAVIFAKAQKTAFPAMKVAGGDAQVHLQSLDIQVEVTGNIAATRYTMVFKNSTNKILEGELLFPLPDGITVSYYALDINGKMREAVPVEKAKATEVFEEIERRRVDPGLLERVEGNNFRTRIYPIPASGTRTVSIGYEEELPVENGHFYYRLPMAYSNAIGHFSIKATVWQSKSKPQIEGNLADVFSFDEQGENFVATYVRDNYIADKSLVFTLPAPVNVPQTLVQPASGSYYFLASCMPKTESRKKDWGNTLGIIWDASLSGLQRDHAKELDVLDRIFKEKKNLSVTLYFLNNRFAKQGVYQITNGNWAALRQALDTAVYDGGTNFGAISLPAVSSDEFLFFSDGLSTLSDADFVAKLSGFTGHPVHCIVSSAKADYSAMKWIAAQTGGKFINLNALSAAQLQNELMYESLHFLGIATNRDVREVYPSIATPVNGNFSVAGILDAEQTSLTLCFGYGNHIEQRIPVQLNTKEAVRRANVYRIWAQKKINELDMRYEQNKKELTELGQQFGIVTRNTSLMVLETLQDYITYNITPPAELQSEAYFQWKKGQEENARRERKDLLDNAISAAKALKNWWDTDFEPQKPKYPKPDNATQQFTNPRVAHDTVFAAAPEAMRMAPPAQGAPPPPQADVSSALSGRVAGVHVEESQSNLQDVTVTAGAPQRSRSYSVSTVSAADMAAPANNAKALSMEGSAANRASQPTIKLAPIKQDTAYTKQLTGDLDKDYAVYLKLRPEYIGTPDFYFNMAEWFFRRNDRERALRILTSIADLDVENASLFRLLGYRMKEYKEYALEAYICKKVIQWRPMEPQSYRDYALALADNGNYQGALDSLYSVLTQPYTQNISQRSNGIEEVVVTEMNQLIAKHPNLHTENIPKELIKAMPVDIRVVINWNMNNTDIDLHLTDPNGETCFYQHKTTAIGGRISNDITQGYGPEQFLLKKAIKGTYGVFVNYYGDSQVKAEGPSTIMVEIYTRYADKTEQRQVVCLQLSKENKQADGKVKVADFGF